MTGAAKPKAVPLQDDYSADELRERARRTHDAKQARRLLALAGSREGWRRNEAACLRAMDAQALRRWAIAFNAEGPDGLINTPPPGRPSKLSPAQKQEIAQLVDAGPDPEQDGVVRWRCVDLKPIIRDARALISPKIQPAVFSRNWALPMSAPERGTRARTVKRSTFSKNQTLPEQVAAIADTRSPSTPIAL
nr:helix-turn-helix domain-containing protein [Salinisphaera sp. LB1]